MTDATLKNGEFHPSAHIAMAYIRPRLQKWLEPIYSSALSGNRTAEICAGTAHRLEKGEPVSDRYLMGLAWFIYELENGEKT